MDRDQKLRKRLNQYILNEGVTAKFIANKLSIHESVLSRYRKDKAELYPEQLDAIELFLNSKQSPNK